ncbi:transmembrane protein 154 isoform X1 [Melanotaenia boesemani]|uniref:transmembrane protein 154 isoform X1 n=1 Tax=Melanotaenia boesemani TaxID=1250792 RepID=UPI001C05141E|nr:transmembrane protein 154 isoform X1 [Melanotaenia boesemani]
MSASLCGNMRGSQVKTSLLLLLLLLLLTSSTRTEEDLSDTTGDPPETNGAAGDPDPISTLQPSSTESHSSEKGDETEGSGSGVYDGGTPENETSTDSANEQDDGSSTITLIIVVLAVVILGMIVGGISFFCQRNKKAINQEDPYLDGSSTEKVPMPMFEEDVPSVQELEMEELDQWMKKDNSPTAS